MTEHTVERKSRIKCLFCRWSHPVWWTSKSGKHVSGWHYFAGHLVDEHPDKVTNEQVYRITHGEGPD